MRVTLAASLLLAAAAAACGSSSGNGVCDCPAGQICVRGRCFDAGSSGGGGGVVVEPLATAATCAAPAQVSGAAIATPQPSAGQCPTGVQSTAAPAEWAPRHVAAQPVNAVVSFQVPAGAASLTITLQAAGPVVAQLPVRSGGSTFTINNTAIPLLVKGPDGRTWYDDLVAPAADPSEQLVFFASDSPTVGTLTIPNTTRALAELGTAGLPGGTWTVTVSDYAYECTLAPLAALCGLQAGLSPAPDLAAYATGVYDVTIVAKPGPRPATGARMDVAFYLHRCPGAEVDATGACLDPPPLTAASAPTDPDAQRMLTTYRGLLAKAGICVGQVTWYDLPDWAQARWAAGLDLDATACDAGLGQLLSLSQPGNRMNLFLVPTLLAKEPDGATTQVVGIDGTIPGPSGLAGTVQSGAAASAANLRERRDRCASAAFSSACGADVTAYIAAHETGHFLGLYHVSEREGDAFDPIADTPRCECRSCAASTEVAQCGTGNVQLTTQQCDRGTATCGGGGNLMFWVLGQTSQGKVSPEQSDVLRANALVR